MAKNKIERIDQEIAKTREKIAEQQEKLKDLEAQKTEAENLEIVQMVRALRMTPAQLSAMLSGGMVPGRAVGSANPEQEEMTHEESIFCTGNRRLCPGISDSGHCASYLPSGGNIRFYKDHQVCHTDGNQCKPCVYSVRQISGRYRSYRQLLL